MTLPLTRTPHDGGQPEARHRVPCGRTWRSRSVSLIRRHAAALGATLERDWAAALLASCALFASAVAAISASAPQRLWGMLAAGAYGLAAVVASAGRRGLPLALAISIGGAVLLPLAWMATVQAGQPEVGVVIRTAGLFLHRGTPYQGARAIAATHNVYNYNPYLPALAVFGLPRAVLGAGPLTDPRIWFGVAFTLGFGWALKLSRVPRPWLCTAVIIASPVVAYPLSTGGDDLPVLAALCLGLALLRPAGGAPEAATGRAGLATRRVILSGVVLGLAAAMKATAGPAVAVAFTLAAARGGWRAAGWLALTVVGVPLAVDGPVLIAQPGPVATNTILFPLGLTKIKTPAASALPGHLIAQAWPGGHWVSIGLILAGGLAIAAWLVIRPPRDERAAGWRLVTGLVIMFGFAPASRFGYVVYPLGLACWLLLATFAAAAAREPGPGLPAGAARRRTGTAT